MNSILIKLIKKIGKVPFLKVPIRFFFKELHKKYTTAIHMQKKDTFNKFGLEALSKFDECMRINNLRYTLAFGSILGAIREKGFIKHDLDIDTFMWIEDSSPRIVECLQEYGFEWISHYSIDNDKYGREDTFSYKGVSLDIFYIYPQINKHPYCCDFVPLGSKTNKRLPRRIELPISKKRKIVKFETLNLYVPENAEEICKIRYGPNYMMPDPKWNWINEKSSIVEWPDKISVTKHYVNPNLNNLNY